MEMEENRWKISIQIKVLVEKPVERTQPKTGE
jgi:hypothetical protein